MSKSIKPAADLPAHGEQHGISSLALRTPFGWMHVNHTEEDDHACLRARQLAGLLALMSGADGSDDMLRLAAKLSAEVAEVISRMLRSRAQAFDEIAMQTRQIAQLLISIQPEEGPDDMLYLAQQLADELVDTVANVLGLQAIVTRFAAAEMAMEGSAV